jgi:prolyl 4-hydroxylase
MNNFVRGNFIGNLSLCDEIIDFYKCSKDKFKGTISNSSGVIVDADVKDSTDCHLVGPLYDQYYAELEKITRDYLSTFPHAICNGDWGVVEDINIQHYQPGQGFKVWHCERGNLSLAYRHLVFMTYLNDVTDGGETEFFHQELKIRPEKGLTLIWPADWTYTHRGVTSPTQEKYIATGWFNFMPPGTKHKPDSE